MNITFQKMQEDDLKLMYKWLTNDFVHQWYDKEKTWTQDLVNKKYLPYIAGKTPVTPFVILVDNNKAGYIQSYLISDYSDYEKDIDIEEKCAGIDLFIGEAAYIHKGLGNEIIKTFLDDYLFNLYDVSLCVIGPEPDNKTAIRAYEKAGFKYVKTAYIKEEDDYEYIMVKHRV